MAAALSNEMIDDEMVDNEMVDEMVSEMVR